MSCFIRCISLNRHTAITAGSSWSNGSIAAPFGENFSYDANGNIIALSRNNNTGQVLDQLSYSYNRNELGKLVNNKLRDVQDPSRPQVADNYTYDEIGNLTADETEGLASISWTVYGKIRQITKTNGSTINYSYDPSGNRVRKVVTQAGGSNPQTTFYTRDAQGNTMAVYEQTESTYKWAEQHLYRSSRLEIFKPAFEVASSQPLGSDEYSNRNDPAANGIFGKKFFELFNHLGNVMVSVSDRTVQQMVGGNMVYRAEELSAQDYYAFGGLMSGRQVSVSDYRYGFNGKENDNEVKGTGNQLDYGMRIHDPRLGRFLSVDPLTKGYPELTPYQFASNRPIDGIDQDGLEYLRYAVVLNKDKEFLSKHVIEDFRYKSEAEMNKIHGTTNFYSKYSAGFGKLGKVVEYQCFIQTEKGLQPYKLAWEVMQQNIGGEITRHGLYYGAGSITKRGPEFEAKAGEYDFSYKPIDLVDAMGRAHDKEEDFSGFKNWQHPQNLFAAIRFVKGLDKYLELSKQDGFIDPFTGRPPSKEALVAAQNARDLFGIEITRKKFQLDIMFNSGKINKDQIIFLQHLIQKVENEDVQLPNTNSNNK